MVYLLDTDHLTVLQRGGEGFQILENRLAVIAPDDYGTTIISYEEQVRGRMAQVARAKSPKESVEYYRLLNANLLFYTNIAVWQYSATAASHFASLQNGRVRIGTQDLRIASIALANNAVLLTRNRRDFSKVPNLHLQDWTI